MERDFQKEAFLRRHTGFSVRVIRLEGGELAVMDTFDNLRYVVPQGSTMILLDAIEQVLDNPPVHRPKPTIRERANNFLKDVGL